MPTELLAVTGATGQLGGRVARRLVDHGVAQRLIVRDADRAPTLPRASVVTATYGDAAAMRAALADVGTLLFVSASEDPDRIALHTTAVDAAVAAGVRRIVYTSFVAAAPDATFTFARDHWHTEEHIRRSGLAFTFLRDSLYLDYLPLLVGPDGVIRGPAGAGRVGAVARDDVADVLTAVLIAEGRYDGRTYDVTGPAAIGMADAAAELTRAVGRPVRYHPETVEEAYRSRAGYGAPDWEVAGWVSTYAAVAAGELDLVSDTVRTIAGHEPMSLAEYLAGDPETVQRLRAG